ncbi:MAG: T9SS type A sorting domain-containing protein [Ignavibacteriales bacterium]|nr:T9SS type A sorting domain-containing protein [Ignavibacteriales bacterium]
MYDILGNEVATLVNEEKEPGIYRAEFNTQDYQLASGIYIYRIQSGKFVETKKMVLMK